MIKLRLLNMVPESKKYITANVLLQWLSLFANIAMMTAITTLLAALYTQTADTSVLLGTLLLSAVALIVRFFANTSSAHMSYLSSKKVKKTLREKIYEKLLLLGPSYNEQTKTSEIVQIAVEGVDQLETYVYAAVFLCDARAADAVCVFELYKPAVRFCAACMCAAHPGRHCGGADMGEKAALQILGTIHTAWRYIPRKPAGSYDPQNLPERRLEERGNE